MTKQEINDVVLDNIIHFMESGHGVCVPAKEATIVSEKMPYIKVTRTDEYPGRPYRLTLRNKGIPKDAQILYWKTKCEWAEEESSRLYGLALEMTR